MKFSLARSSCYDDCNASRLKALQHASYDLRDWGVLGETQDLPSSPVCLDYVRLKLWPGEEYEDGPRYARQAAALLDKKLRDNPASLNGESGVFGQRTTSINENTDELKSTPWTWIRWRRDGDRPAVLSVETDEE